MRIHLSSEAVMPEDYIEGAVEELSRAVEAGGAFFVLTFTPHEESEKVAWEVSTVASHPQCEDMARRFLFDPHETSWDVFKVPPPTSH